ncbi:protein kinase [Streptomyces sp. NPDC051976]|uniref:protein kinase domain-containing protein n=1 Tax=Streptomyces sp. NPDC051976 TaxID=3154947 RepID=UPI0034453634
MQYTPYDEWARVIGDRYALREAIGRGGMAEVWSAEDLVLHRTVAVKLMHTQLAFDDVAQTRFQREARAAASLNHPCVAAVYDAGCVATTPPRPYLVMEYVAGQTAADRLRSAPPTPEEAVAWVAGTLDALACAHAAGLVHRDIKPANVMITPDGQVKVMDFGIAHVASAHDTGLTAAGNVLGTVAYMSPEQVRGQSVDSRSDLYSTGCMLYELLTGRPPFVGETPLTVAYQHVYGDAPAPADLGIRLPAPVEDALARAMAKNPDDRFPTAAAMRDALLAPRTLPFASEAPGTVATEAETVSLQDDSPTALLPSADDPRRSLRRRSQMVLASVVVLTAGGLLAATLPLSSDATPATGPRAETSLAAGSTSARPRTSSSGTNTGRSGPGRSGGGRNSSAGPRTSAHASGRSVLVPADLVGTTLGQARAELAGLGLSIALTPGSSSRTGSTVMATLPAAGTQVASGDTVLLATQDDGGSATAPGSGSSASSGSGGAGGSGGSGSGSGGSGSTSSSGGTDPAAPPPLPPPGPARPR